MVVMLHLPSSFQIKEEDKDQESNHHVPHLTGKRLNTRKHQECQEASPFPGWKEQTRPYAKDKHETKVTKRSHKRSTALERSEKILEGLNMFNGINPNFNSDVD